jgi:hypothetical protein
MTSYGSADGQELNGQLDQLRSAGAPAEYAANRAIDRHLG